LTLPERTPKIFDYIAGAILTNGLAMVAVYLAAWEILFQYLLIPLWFIASGVSAYLVCMRTTRNHLVTGGKMAVLAIIMGFFMVPTLQNVDLSSLVLILVSYIVGSVGGAYYALRTQLKMKKKAALSLAHVEP
jgi:hypothetical protein